MGTSDLGRCREDAGPGEGACRAVQGDWLRRADHVHDRARNRAGGEARASGALTPGAGITGPYPPSFRSAVAGELARSAPLKVCLISGPPALRRQPEISKYGGSDRVLTRRCVPGRRFRKPDRREGHRAGHTGECNITRLGKDRAVVCPFTCAGPNRRLAARSQHPGPDPTWTAPQEGALRDHDPHYKRHGTAALFAALDLLDGTVIGQVHLRHRHQEFLKFLARLEREFVKDLELHLILDNYGTHTHPKVKAWLAKHPRFKNS